MFNLKNVQFPTSMEAQDDYFAIVGFALNGPVNSPFMVRENSNPYDVLGKCPLADACHAARVRGVNPLLLRLNGSYGQARVFASGDTVITFTSVEAYDDVNKINITVYPTHIRVTGVTGNERFYLFSQYATLDKLMTAINGDAKYGVGEITMTTDYPDLLCSALTETAYDIWLEDGNDEENYVSQFDGTDAEEKIQMQVTKIKESLLEEYQIDDVTYYSHNSEFGAFNLDTILVVDVMHEDAPELAEILGRYCESKSGEQDSFCSGVMGSMYFREFESDEYDYAPMVKHLVEIGTKSNSNYYLHVEIVVGVGEPSEENKMPLATKFATERYLLSIDSSATNKEIANITTLFSRLRKEDIASLAASGYTCIIPSIRRGHVAYKSTCFVENKNLITSKPHYSRAARYHANQIIKSLDSFIGESATSLKLLAMEKFIKDEIQVLSKQGVYKSVDFTIEDLEVDEIKITLIFVIYGELDNIQTSAFYSTTRKMVIEWT